MELCKLTSLRFLQETQKYNNVAQSEYLGLERGLMLFWHLTAFYVLFCMAVCLRASPLLTHIPLSKLHLKGNNEGTLGHKDISGITKVTTGLCSAHAECDLSKDNIFQNFHRPQNLQSAITRDTYRVFHTAIRTYYINFC
jgi:hypothetical protein